MKSLRLALLTTIALAAFAGNSIICRTALKNTAIDAASFTTIRLLSGALVLWGIAHGRREHAVLHGNWKAAFALFAYAACFSFAYSSLSASTGALLLFGSVQATMIGWGVMRGERLHGKQFWGLLLALSGFMGLIWPGLSAPPLGGTFLMVVSGISWGIYSLLGKGVSFPIAATAGNFIRSAVAALLLSLIFAGQAQIDVQGGGLAVISGVVTSGMGYAVWYTVLPYLKASQAATAQLTVPLISALVAIPILGESMSQRLVAAGFAVLMGIAMVIKSPKR